MAGFDEDEFIKRLLEVKQRDPELKQLREEWQHQKEKYEKLRDEVEKLEEREKKLKDGEKKRDVQQQLQLKTLERDLAEAKYEKAGYQQGQRSSTLRKDLLLHDLKTSTNDDMKKEIQRRVEAVERRIWLQMRKPGLSDWKSKATDCEERLAVLRKEESKHLLDEALKAGFVGVIIVVCVVLGPPGSGKTSLKYLLLDQRPPELRSSTICAETPLRIEIKQMSEARIQTLDGNWKEVEGEEMLDIVARMILLAERDATLSVKGLKKQKGVLSKIINWVTKHGKTASPAKKWPTGGGGTESSSTAFGGGGADGPSGAGKRGASAGVGALSTDACRSAIVRIMDKLVKCITRLRSQGGELEGVSHSLTQQLLRSLWIYFSDCGGQPQYHELLPIFVRSISSALCVTRLTDRFDEIPAAEYYDKGKRVGVPQQSQLSAKDTLKCLVRTIQSYSTQEKPPSIIMVGTHLDQLEEKMKKSEVSQASPAESSSGAAAQPSAQPPQTGERIETLEEKNAQIMEMLGPEFPNQLVYYQKSQPLFPLNALSRGRREKNVAHSIRSAVEKSGAREVKIPVWWYVLELLLQELAKELHRGVLSRTECLLMAQMLDIHEKSLDAALVHFDELNVIKYFPEALPNVVFVNSQIPLDKVSELVYQSYLLAQPAGDAEADEPLPERLMTTEWNDFRDYGVVSDDCLKHFPRHFVTGIFTENDFSKLLTKRLVFAEIPPPKSVKEASESEQRYYLMLTLLTTLPEAELEKCRVSSSAVATLLVRFPDHSRRAGVFCCLVSHFIRHFGRDLLLESNQRLHRNCVKLQLLTTPPCMMTLIDSGSYIEVHVDIQAPVPLREYAGHFPIIRQAILNGVLAACSALNYKATKPELAFFCPHSSPSPPSHPTNQPLLPQSTLPSPPSSSGQPQKVKEHTATVSRDKKRYNVMYWCCDVKRPLCGLLDERHYIWFGQLQATQGAASDQDPATTPTADSLTLDAQPSLANLSCLRTSQAKKVKTIERIAHTWRSLGDLLNFDDFGSKLANIEDEHRGKPEACCRAVFQHWIQGNGVTPCSWRTLIGLLDDLDEVVLAQDIREALH